jgi:hypothetical protein
VVAGGQSTTFFTFDTNHEMGCSMSYIYQPVATVTAWRVEIRGEENVIPEKLMIAESVGNAWGLRWTVARDPADRPDVLCLLSNEVHVSLTPAAFVKVRDEVGHRLAEKLESWVSICVTCNDYELHSYFETRGSEAIL